MRHILTCLVLASIALTPPSASAWFGTFTASGHSGDGSLSGFAGVTTGNGTITIALQNMLDASLFTSSGQALSGFDFSLHGLSSPLTSAGKASSAGALIDIGATGSVTIHSGAVTENWTYSVSGGDTVQITSLGHGKDDLMIAANGSKYANAKDLKNYDPYYRGSATITITGLKGVTSNTTVGTSDFSFGTGGFVVRDAAGSPEPMSLVLWALCGVGVAGLAVISRRRRTP